MKKNAPARLIITVLVTLGFFTACGTTPDQSASEDDFAIQFQRVSFDMLPGWAQDNIAEVWPAWQMGCRALSKKEAATWREICTFSEMIDASSSPVVRRFFEQYFAAYQIVLKSDATQMQESEGLVTGYYEPLLRGSRTSDNHYRFPVYGKPADLLTVDLASLYPELAGKRVRGRINGDKVVPYYSRAEIDSGHTVPNAEILLYLDEALDAFFLHIQGSGRVMLPSNDIVRIGYADQNGHPYRAIGAILIERGELNRENVSMQTIKAWGYRHPEQLPELFAHNPSYVFFREIAAPTDPLAQLIDGPTGALGVPLLAQRTIAVDRSKLPIGAPVYLATTLPDQSPLQRLTMAQDTGGAIRGALRADFFFGTGDTAGEFAGAMKEKGRFWLLWPKDKALPGKR